MATVTIRFKVFVEVVVVATAEVTELNEEGKFAKVHVHHRKFYFSPI